MTCPTPLYKIMGDSWPPPKPDPDEEFNCAREEEGDDEAA